MPGPCPQEFREYVVAVAQRREPGVTLARISTDSGVSEATLSNWPHQAEVEDGRKPGRAAVESEELRAANRRIRSLEQEDKVLRKAAAYLAQADLELGGSPK